MPQLYIFAATYSRGMHLWYEFQREHPELAGRFGRVHTRHYCVKIEELWRGLRGRTARVGDLLLSEEVPRWHEFPTGFLPRGGSRFRAIRQEGPWIYECLSEIPPLTSVDEVVAFLLEGP